MIKRSMQRDLDAVYTYNTEGQVTSVKYPSWDDSGSGSWQVTPGGPGGGPGEDRGGRTGDVQRVSGFLSTAL